MNAPTTPQVPLLDLDLLRTMVAIAETGSFSGAATMVHRTPSAVSMQVKRLEEAINRSLFVRDSRSVSLTVDGTYLLEHARRMLALNAEAQAHFLRPDLRGRVRLGAIDDIAERFLPGLLRRFADSHPGVAIEVRVESGRAISEMMHQDQLDLGLVTVDQGFHSDARAELVFREPLVWAVCRGGVAAEQDPLPVSVWEAGCCWRQAGLEGLDRIGRAWRIAFESAHIAAQRAAIQADLAVAPLARSSLGGDVIEAPAHLGLPPLPDYGIALMTRPEATSPILAAADHLRAGFAST